MSDHKNAGEQAGQEVEPVAWRFRFPTGRKWHFAEFGPHELSRRELEWQPLYTHPAPSQEGHAAGPACSAPDEALEMAVAHDAYKSWGRWRIEELSFKFAIRWAIREYVRRSAGKNAIHDPEGQHYAGEKL